MAQDGDEKVDPGWVPGDLPDRFLFDLLNYGPWACLGAWLVAEYVLPLFGR